MKARFTSIHDFLVSLYLKGQIIPISVKREAEIRAAKVSLHSSLLRDRNRKRTLHPKQPTRQIGVGNCNLVTDRSFKLLVCDFAIVIFT